MTAKLPTTTIDGRAHSQAAPHWIDTSTHWSGVSTSQPTTARPTLTRAHRQISGQNIQMARATEIPRSAMGTAVGVAEAVAVVAIIIGYALSQCKIPINLCGLPTCNALSWPFDYIGSVKYRN